jgi:hypothetical protein
MAGGYPQAPTGGAPPWTPLDLTLSRAKGPLALFLFPLPGDN